MNITFLGTGTSHGVPFIGCRCEVCTSSDKRDQRLRTSIHLQIDGKSMIIDSGPDFRQQVLRHDIRRLDALIFTHEHKDHTGGMDEIRSYNQLQEEPIPVFATEAVWKRLKMEFSYIFSGEQYPGIPQVEEHYISNQPFEVLGTTFEPILVMHYKMPVFGYRIGDFTYVTDAKDISAEEKAKMKGSKVLVLNALQHEQNIAHLTLSEALALAEEVEAERVFFTHISHQLGRHEEIARELPSHVSLAYDGLVIEV
ncbi:MAG: MBL fold metallo-hydrolase [Cyclobacteriaceae bacterium]